MNFNQRDMTATRMKMTHGIFLGTILNECPGQIHALLLEEGEKRKLQKPRKRQEGRRMRNQKQETEVEKTG